MNEERPDFTELTLLRTFYAHWTTFHSIPRTNLHRNRKEAAAQEMVDAHHGLMLFYQHHAKPLIALATVDGKPVADAVADALSSPAEQAPAMRKVTMLEPEFHQAPAEEVAHEP